MFLVFGVYLLLWAFVAGSIVVTFTAAPSGGLVDTLFRAPGQFYLETVLTLRQFALLTTLPVRWTDIGYAALSVVPLGIHFFITSVGIDVAAEQYWKDSDAGIHFLLVGVVIAVLVIFGAVLLELGAQLLVLSLLAIGVALLTLAFAAVFIAS
ncbi:hypothetical protein [Halobellus clavatus]|jgi:hypothetical protein|uniref:Uncharacterized protein n=1 Tax=Halobellus clavatus TaxID=660517 RepID=A0A1H3J5Z3_9EURY|nr:hypothetical protein [Halobellus clavatus]SDY35217.1 hypothetical protein SAMN04487946_11228 [Halobellus clavatus]